MPKSKNKKLVLPSIEPLKSIDFYPFAYALYNEYLTNYCWYCLSDQIKHR